MPIAPPEEAATGEVEAVLAGTVPEEGSMLAEGGVPSVEPAMLRGTESTTMAGTSSASSGSSTSLEGLDRGVFEWYAVRPPGARASKVCVSHLAKRHVAVSPSCLLFRRVYTGDAALACKPPPLSPFDAMADDEYSPLPPLAL